MSVWDTLTGEVPLSYEMHGTNNDIDNEDEDILSTEAVKIKLDKQSIKITPDEVFTMFMSNGGKDAIADADKMMQSKGFRPVKNAAEFKELNMKGVSGANRGYVAPINSKLPAGKLSIVSAIILALGAIVPVVGPLGVGIALSLSGGAISLIGFAKLKKSKFDMRVKDINNHAILVLTARGEWSDEKIAGVFAPYYNEEKNKAKVIRLSK